MPGVLTTGTKKNSVVAASDAECAPNFDGPVKAALWHNKFSVNKTDKKCCLTNKVMQGDGMVWCMDMNINGACKYSGQCKSGYCDPQSESCKSKKAQYAIASSDSECDSNRAAWASYGLVEAKRCCPGSGVTADAEGKSWCTGLPVNSSCKMNPQCESNYCANDGFCKPQKVIGDTVKSPWAQNSNECKSGGVGLYNNQGVDSDMRCCPTPAYTTLGGRRWCTALPNAYPCIYGWQCGSTFCSPGGDAYSVCVATPPGMLYGKRIRFTRVQGDFRGIKVRQIQVYDTNRALIPAAEITPSIFPEAQVGAGLRPGESPAGNALQYGAHRLINGDTTGGGVAWTTSGSPSQNTLPYVELNLLNNTAISEIKIYNSRSNGYPSSSLRGMQLLVYNEEGQMMNQFVIPSVGSLAVYSFPPV